MPRTVAFLRAINVGGHIVKMDRLREVFESLGFSNVETFIASGNVVFDTKSKNLKALESKIEKALYDALGYEVATFLRTESELTAIAEYKPFPVSQIETAVALNVGLLAGEVGDEARKKFLALKTDMDDFHVNGREVYWVCLQRQSESRLSYAVFEKALGAKATFRGINTINRLAAKYCR
jgi:uncharacterized protein (DUF1697 family)